MTEIQPVVIKTGEVEPAELVTIFVIDDTEYKVPKRLTPNVSIGFLRDIGRLGYDRALARAMDTVLGAGAMDALAECEAATEDDIAQIMNLIEGMLFGSLETKTGKSRKGRKK